MRKNIVIIMLFCILSPLYTENINNDFELSIKLNKDANAIFITIRPKRDIQIKGLSEKEPFIILSGTGVIFENDGILIRTEYIIDSKPELLQFPFRPVDDTLELTSLDVHLEMTYVPCLISSGVCKFPQTIKHDYLIKASGMGMSLAIINTGILIGLFILGLVGLLFYLKYKKDIIFTGFLLLIFSGVLFYTFIPLYTTEISQADYSRDIAATLCLSCIGIESATETIPVKSSEMKFYAGLTEPVVITVFSAPWCGSCPAAKTYVKELCALYDTILSYEIVDISLPTEKERYLNYQTIYTFKEPIPLPAIIVSNNTSDVFYGTQGLGSGIIQLITKGLHGLN